MSVDSEAGGDDFVVGETAVPSRACAGWRTTELDAKVTSPSRLVVTTGAGLGGLEDDDDVEVAVVYCVEEEYWWIS
jgi:hypothetical protein